MLKQYPMLRYVLQKAFRDVEMWRERSDSDMTTIGIAPYSLYTCHPLIFSELADYASDGTTVAIHLAGSREEYEATRNRPGNLLLLDKSTNSSINDSRYPKKLPVYASDRGNVLSAALVVSSYDNNPRFHKFMQQTGFAFKAYEAFGREQIAERSELVKTLALALWTQDFDEIVAGSQQ